MESKRFLFDDSWNISRVYLTGIMTPTYHHPCATCASIIIFCLIPSICIHEICIYHMYFYVYKYIHTYPIGMISLEWEPIIPSNWVRWDVCLPLASRHLKVGHSGTITCAAISPDASFVVSTGSEAISGEPSNGTGTLKRLWCKTTRKGGNGWGKQISKNGSNQYFFGKTYGVFLD